MGPAINCATAYNLKVTATVVLIFILTFPLPIPVGSEREKGVHRIHKNTMSLSRSGEVEEEMTRKKAVQLGSRPPGCLNKCMNCRPCQATLVIPPHHHTNSYKNAQSSASRRDDDPYYLLLWKCRCGDKLFQP